MPTLASQLRNQLERVVIEARDVAEAGARAALEEQAVHHHEPYGHMKAAQRELRNHLRARARQLGDRQDSSGRLAIDHLAGECAYEHWHRMLFARFLAENGLLIEPEMGVAMSLAEAEELAKEEGVDVWVFASRCAQRMLPQIFRPDDPLLQITFATEHMVELERLLDSLPPAVFTASDALGWVYQHWQSKKKDEVNRSEVKIGADEISAVTQLFTEPYMVEFLLHNTLGAWWAGKQLSDADAAGTKSEDELRRKLALPGVGWGYLRFVRGDDGEGGPWRPAAGTFDGWPKTAAELRVLDPCCGSGHFLVAALHHLVPIRMAEEGLSAADAVEAVLRDNLHGLEIDERCCQIAAFALAFAAWTYPDAGGYRVLPELHIACAGIAPNVKRDDWLALAGDNSALRNGMDRLYGLFRNAADLGSLIDPGGVAGLLAGTREELVALLNAAVQVTGDDYERKELAVSAKGVADAVDLLGRRFTTVVTNVPYLGRGEQGPILAAYGDDYAPDARLDLATLFVQRCLDFLSFGGTLGIVSPQNWLFLARYKKLRKRLLAGFAWNSVARIGEHGFESSAAAGAFTALKVITRMEPTFAHRMAVLDAGVVGKPAGKAALLRGEAVIAAEEYAVGSEAKDDTEVDGWTDADAADHEANGSVGIVKQMRQLRNPDSRILVVALPHGDPLIQHAIVSEGLHTGDYPRFGRKFWEVPEVSSGWALQQGAPRITTEFAGREHVLFWEGGTGELVGFVQERLGDQALSMWIKGEEVWGKTGVAVSAMRSLKATVYTGEVFTHGAYVIVPRNTDDFPALWQFCKSQVFRQLVRALDQKVCVARAAIEQTLFDVGHWRELAARSAPIFPEITPELDQWSFQGNPADASDPLHAAVARLLGYRWPNQKNDSVQKFADADGIVCLPSVRGEEPASERLAAILAAVGGKPAKARELAGGTGLDDWLRNRFFEEHCKLFQHRPFVWHVWDGRKRDGFHALVNYHKLCERDGKGRKLLESLTYSYLGDWINRCKDDVRRGEGGAEDRLAAAVALQERLKAIIAGEPPFDLFVRWKPLAEQAIGWEPDTNDGVRANIRPFLASDLLGGRKGAGVLRYRPNIHWNKDRGKEPERPKNEFPWLWGWNPRDVDFLGGRKFDGNRWNDCHYSMSTRQPGSRD